MDKAVAEKIKKLQANVEFVRTGGKVRGAEKLKSEKKSWEDFSKIDPYP